MLPWRPFWTQGGVWAAQMWLSGETGPGQVWILQTDGWEWQRPQDSCGFPWRKNAAQSKMTDGKVQSDLRDPERVPLFGKYSLKRWRKREGKKTNRFYCPVGFCTSNSFIRQTPPSAMHVCVSFISGVKSFQPGPPCTAVCTGHCAT
jgi:hypothetical protein